MSEPRPEEPAIYLMKAHLFYLRPSVWRRFLVRRESSMEHLHQVICCLFDFDRNNPYMFRAAKVRYRVGFDEKGPEDIGDAEGHHRQVEQVDEKTIPISSLVELLKGRKSHSDRNIFFYYETPDSTKIVERNGDAFLVFSEHRNVDWTAVISCEKVLPVEETYVYPLCTEGERASPPSCFSDHSDYSTFLDNLKRLDKYTMIKGLKRYYGDESEEIVKLVNNNFDPASLHIDKINHCLGQIVQR